MSSTESLRHGRRAPDDLPPLLHGLGRARFANHRAAIVTLVVAAAVLVAVLLTGSAFEDAATRTDFLAKNLPPGPGHLFGTDWMGRDMFWRTLAGLANSIRVGLLAATVSALIALTLGTASALGGRRVDAAITWLIDLVLGVPHIVLLILISFALGKGYWGVTVGIAVTHWPSLARVVRAEVLQCRAAGFVEVAQKLGRSRVQIAVQHVLPYVLPQFLVGLALLFPHAILHEAAVTFLGFGLPPEQPAIGIILSEAMKYLSAGLWWLAIFPGVALVLVVVSFDLVGTRLRRVVNPSSAQD